MPSFKANGKNISFKAKKKRKKPMSQLTPYQKHIRKGMTAEKKKCDKGCKTMDAAKTMKKLAKQWKSKKCR